MGNMTPQDVALLPQWPDAVVVVVATIVLAIIARVLINLAIDRLVRAATQRAERHRESEPTRSGRFWEQAGLATERTRQRTATLGSLLKSISTFVLVLIAVMTIMNVVGIPMGPVLTSAGVLGVAVGFGAQSLVKDFLSGVFMLAEDQYGVGDFIDIGTVKGTVEEVTLRVVRLRDPSGQVWYVPNGEIKRVGNLSQGWSTAMVDLPIAYDEDPSRALGVLREVVGQLDADQAWRDVLLEAPTVLGVDSVTDDAMTLRILLKCAPNQQWGVQRELRTRAKAALADAGIRGPARYRGFAE